MLADKGSCFNTPSSLNLLLENANWSSLVALPANQDQEWLHEDLMLEAGFIDAQILNQATGWLVILVTVLIGIQLWVNFRKEGVRVGSSWRYV